MSHKTTKALIALCFMLLMLLTLVACGSNQTIDESANSSTIEETSDIQESSTIDKATPTPKPSKEPTPTPTQKPTSSKSEDTTSQEPTPTPTPTPKPTTQETKPPQTTTTPTTPTTPPHTHDWVTTTIHHEEVGHYETKTTYEEVIVGYTPKYLHYFCKMCDFETTSYEELDAHSWEYGHNGNIYNVEGGDPIIEQQEVTTNEWVVDTQAWDETITKCSGCGATK